MLPTPTLRGKRRGKRFLKNKKLKKPYIYILFYYIIIYIYIREN